MFVRLSVKFLLSSYPVRNSHSILNRYFRLGIGTRTPKSRQTVVLVRECVGSVRSLDGIFFPLVTF